MDTKPIKVFFLTRSVGMGGAQRQLALLLSNLDPGLIQPTLGVFYDGGELAGPLAELPYLNWARLAKRGRWDLAGFLWRTARAIRESGAQAVYGFLTDANLLAIPAARLAGNVPVVWGIRSSNMKRGDYGPAVKAALALASPLSRFCRLAISNSQAALAESGLAGRPETMVIHNGLNTGQFAPDPAKRTAFRRELGLGPGDFLVGWVGRSDPKKDIPGFLEAARLAVGQAKGLRFLMAGPGLEPGGAAHAQAQALGLGDRVRFWGPLSDPAVAYNAMDLFVLSSAFGEGFPNVLGEAMACGRPCLATDVGDGRMVLGEAGRVIAPSDPRLLADAMLEFFRTPAGEREALGQTARARIMDHFSIKAMVDSTTRALRAVAAK